MAAPKPPAGVPLNRSHPLAENLVTAFTFNYPAARERVFEYMPSTVGAGVTMAPRGLSFNGASTGNIQFTDRASFNVSKITSWAIRLWVRNWPVASAFYLANIWSNENDTFSTPTATWRIGSQGDPAFAQRLGINFFDTTDHDTQNNTDLTLQVWTDIVVTTDGTNANWYINGVLDTQVAHTITPTNSSNAWIIGTANPAGDRPFDGIIEYLYRWDNRALTPGEVQRLHNDPYCLFSPRPLRRFELVNVPAAAVQTPSPWRLQGGMGALIAQ